MMGWGELVGSVKYELDRTGKLVTKIPEKSHNHTQISLVLN